MSEFNHIPVLLKECIEGLNIKKDGIYVDGTLGGAGHSKEICKLLSDKGLLIGIDRDIEAIKYAKEKIKQYNNVEFINDNYNNMKKILESLGIEKVEGILLDLGVSSYQIDETSRGFSYINNAPLDMRMNQTQSLTAEHIVNTYKEENLAKIIYEYGEERFSRQIARRICEERKKKPITTTAELADIIKKVVPYNKQGHPAKRTFQAIRIEVNNEIEPLYKAIEDAIDCLKIGGRLCVITFHSLEDRIVKKAYLEAIGKKENSRIFAILSI